MLKLIGRVAVTLSLLGYYAGTPSDAQQQPFDVFKIFPPIRCETTVVREWSHENIWGAEHPVSKEACSKFPDASFDSLGRYDFNADCRPNPEYFDDAADCYRLTLVVGCHNLIRSLALPAEKFPRLACLLGGPRPDEEVYSGIFASPFVTFPNAIRDGARCTELPTRELSKAGNADLFAPILKNLPVGSDWTAVKSLLERNGFAKSPDQSGHFWRVVPFVLQWEIEEDRPWLENTQLGDYAYSIYAGRRLAPRGPNRQYAVPDNGPAEGLCMFLDT